MKLKLSILFIPFLLFSSFPLGAVEIIPLEEIKPGMKGVGKTVFKGTEPEEFELEVIDILKGLTPKKNLIIARLKGDFLEHTGVIAGMSGSPIFIQGKLAGALAYSFGWFPKEPIAGIIPIEQMLSSLREEKESSSLPLSPKKNSPFPLFVFPSSPLKPIYIPFLFQEIPSLIQERLSPWFERWNFLPVEIPSFSSTEEKVELLPGSAVGISLLEGDWKVSALGTVTFREGEKIFAMGHPLFRAGKVSLPMSGAKVHLVIPSQLSSFKLASPTEPVGSIVEDREYGLLGIMGEPAHMLPLKIKVGKEDYNFRVMDHRDLSPFLVQLSTIYAILTTSRILGEDSLRMREEIKLKDGRKVEREDMFSGSFVPFRAGEKIYTILRQIMKNRFEEVEIEKVSLTIELLEEPKIARIEKVMVNKKKFKPGEEIEVTVTLKLYREEKILTKKINFFLPQSMGRGKLTLRVSGGKEAWRRERARVSSKYQPQDLNALLRLIEEEERGDRLVVELFLPLPGVAVKGKEFPLPPLSFLEVMKSEKEVGDWQVVKERKIYKKSLPFSYVVEGSKTLSLEIVGG